MVSSELVVNCVVIDGVVVAVVLVVVPGDVALVVMELALVASAVSASAAVVD